MIDLKLNLTTWKSTISIRIKSRDCDLHFEKHSLHRKEFEKSENLSRWNSSSAKNILALLGTLSGRQS